MANNLFIPKSYQSLLDIKQTEKAIKLVKDFFQSNLASELRLRRVTAPLFVLRGTGINDDLNGTERKVSFPIKDMNEQVAEVVNSLAKWKRMALADYEIETGQGIYTDMNAIRPDEIMDNIHSMYVDQWDWERVITAGDRNIDFLKKSSARFMRPLNEPSFLYTSSLAILNLSCPKRLLFPFRRTPTNVSDAYTARTRN